MNYPTIYHHNNPVIIDETQSVPLTWETDIDTLTITPITAKCYWTLHERFTANKWRPITLHMKFEEHTLEIIPVTNQPYIKDIEDVLYYYAEHSEIPISTNSLIELAAILVQYESLCKNYRTALKDMQDAFSEQFKDYDEIKLQEDLDLFTELKKDHYRTSSQAIAFHNIDKIIDVWRRCHKWSKTETEKRKNAAYKALYYQSLCRDYAALTHKEPNWSTWSN